MISVAFAVPGDLDNPTGGYAYARQLLAAAPSAKLELVHWPLPQGFPRPDKSALDETTRRLWAVPRGWPILIDGLALGVLPNALLSALSESVIALCHHPLACETGLAAEEAARLAASERAALGRTVAVITTSATTADTLIRDYGVYPARITVARPGIQPASRARGSVGRDVSILAVGTLAPRKGHDLLLRALARTGHDNWRLTIVGSDTADLAHAAALRELAGSLGLAERVTFTGALPEDEVARQYDRADLFALASHYEGFGMAYAEAIARGLPVLGTTGGAIPEATAGAARLVAPGDEPALAAALGELIADPAARAHLAARAWQAAASLPRWSDTAAAVAGAIRGVIAASPHADAAE